MALKDRMQLLTTPAQVDEFLKKNPSSALFKAGTCHKTPETFRAVEEQLGPREDLPIGIVRVVEARPASNHIETLTGIRHESPSSSCSRTANPCSIATTGTSKTRPSRRRSRDISHRLPEPL